MREKIKIIVGQTLNLKDIPDNASMENIENWDSLKHLMLIANLESAFNISIEPENIASMRSIYEIESVLIKLLKQQ